MSESEIHRTYAKIVNTQKQLDELYEHLGCSLVIQEIWPEAFAEDCSCSPILIGTNWPKGGTIPLNATKYPPPYHRVRKISRTFLRRSDGVEEDISTGSFFRIFVNRNSTHCDNPPLLPRGIRGKSHVTS